MSLSNQVGAWELELGPFGRVGVGASREQAELWNGSVADAKEV